jgi:hypothetical protein
MATLWLALAKVGCCTPSWLMAAVMPLARAQALVRSIVMTHTAWSTVLQCSSSTSWASMATCSLMSLPRRCTALRSASAC